MFFQLKTGDPVKWFYFISWIWRYYCRSSWP